MYEVAYLPNTVRLMCPIWLPNIMRSAYLLRLPHFVRPLHFVMLRHPVRLHEVASSKPASVSEYAT